MGAGREGVLLYSAGVTTTVTNASDPLDSLGGSSPQGSGTGLDKRRASEMYCETSWNSAPTDRASGELSAAFTNGIVFAAPGGWLLAIEQNESTPGSFDAADDARGSYAKILTMSAASNESAAVTMTLDRELSGLGTIGDHLRVAFAGNVFQNVTAEEAQTGIVDYSHLWFYKADGTLDDDSDDMEFWVDPINSNGASIEVMHPGIVWQETITRQNWANVLTDRFESPWDQFGFPLEFTNGYLGITAPGERVNQALGLANGTVLTSSATNWFGSVWLKRTIPAGSLPGESLFIFRLTSTTAKTGTVALSDFNKMNSGTPIVWETAQVTPRNLSITVDRLIYAGSGARITATVTDGSGVALENRWINMTASDGTITQDATVFSNSAGKVIVTFELSAASVSTDITFSASLVDPA